MNSSMVSCQKKSTTDVIFAMRMLIEKSREGQRELLCVFVDTKKAYDKLPREDYMRKSGVAEKYVRVVQDTYESCKTMVRWAVGVKEIRKVEDFKYLGWIGSGMRPSEGQHMLDVLERKSGRPGRDEAILSAFECLCSYFVRKKVEFSLLLVKVTGRNLSVMFIFLAWEAIFLA